MHDNLQSVHKHPNMSDDAEGLKKLFPTNVGYCTSKGRVDWCKFHGIVDAASAQTVTKSLVANRDPSTPLYHWQLFSLLGYDAIKELVTDFYQSVYTDTDELEFRDAFVRISDAEHHIQSQTDYWYFLIMYYYFPPVDMLY